MKTIISELPNWLTLLRLALIPIFVILMIDPTRAMLWVATWVFIAAAVTDYLDGYVARRFRAVSDLGKLLDPLADKILVMAALVMLAAIRSPDTGSPWVPGWMVVLVLAREIWVTGLRGVAAAQGEVIAAAISGKVKSALQMVSIVALLLFDYPVVLLGFVVPAHLIGLNLLFLSILFSYWGAVQYTVAVAQRTSLRAPEGSDD